MRSILALCALAFLSACPRDSGEGESRTTEPADDGKNTIAQSKDGLFELVISADGYQRPWMDPTDYETPQTIRIDTHRNVEASELIGAVYEVRVTNIELSKPAEVRMHIPPGASADNYKIVTFDANEAPLFGSRYEPELGYVHARIDDFSNHFFGLEAAAFDPCTGLRCGEPCSTCPPNDVGCVQVMGVCNAIGACGVSADACEASDGDTAAPGTGRAFVMNQISIAAQPLGGALWQFGELGNDQIRQGLLGGESLFMFEVSGIEEPFTGDDRSVTLKLYGARDADDPYFPGNNFKAPPGHDTCCEFLVLDSSTDVDHHARSRLPGAVRSGVLTARGETEISFIALPLLGYTLLVRGVEATFSSTGDQLSLGRMEAVARIADLAWTVNPYCTVINPRCTVALPGGSMLDLISALLMPDVDVDLDGDGLERVEDSDGDGRIDRCYDGCIGACTTPAEVEPIDPFDPTSCTLNPKMADGYSVGFNFTAVAAKIVGTTQLAQSWELDVFYPVDGVVYGHADIDGYDFSVSHLSVETGTQKVDATRAENGYDFEIGATSGDIVTVTSLRSPHDSSGDSVEVVVPPLPPETERYVCCMSNSTGRCQTQTDFLNGVPCPTGQSAPACFDITGCDALNNIIDFPDSLFSVWAGGGRIVLSDGGTTAFQGALVEARNGSTIKRAVLGTRGTSLAFPDPTDNLVEVSLSLPDGRHTRARLLQAQ